MISYKLLYRVCQVKNIISKIKTTIFFTNISKYVENIEVKRKSVYIIVCIPERFNTNISHKLFDYKITFVNSQQENTNSNGDYVLKNWF